MEYIDPLYRFTAYGRQEKEKTPYVEIPRKTY